MVKQLCIRSREQIIQAPTVLRNAASTGAVETQMMGTSSAGPNFEETAGAAHRFGAHSSEAGIMQRVKHTRAHAGPALHIGTRPSEDRAVWDPKC